MKQFLSIFFSFLFALHAHAGFVLERIDGTIWDQVERLRVPNNQLVKLGDKRYLLETGNENVLVNPNFQSSQVAQGWTYNPANFDLVKLDDTYAYTGTHSLQLDLKHGNFTDLELISQTYAAGYKLGGSDLEASIRIAKAVLDPAVTLKWCASVDSVIVNCVTVPSLPANTSFQKYAVAFASKSAYATTYKVGLYATYNVVAGAVGILALADASLKPYSGKGIAPPQDNFSAFIATTGVVSRKTGPDHISGNAVVSSTSLFTITLTGLTSEPNCEVSIFTPDSPADVTAKITSVTPSQIVIRTSSNNANSLHAFTLSCLKTGNDLPQPTVTPEAGANLLGTHFYTREPQCPVNSVSDNATITRAQYPALFAKWQIAAGTDTLALANAGLVIRSTGTQTFGGKTYTATLNQKRNDDLEAHNHTESLTMTVGAGDVDVYKSGYVDTTGRALSGAGIFSTNQRRGTTSQSGSGSETHGPDIAHTGCYWAVANPFLPIGGLVVSPDASAAGRSEVINTIKTVSANYTLTNQDETIRLTASGNFTLSLPPAALYKGKKYYLTKTDNNTNLVTVDPSGSETICGKATIAVAGPLDSITIQSDGSSWVGLNNSCYREFSGAYMAATYGASCTSNPCTVHHQVGFLPTVNRLGGGSYNIVLPAGVISGAFVCTINSELSGQQVTVMPGGSGFSATNFSFKTGQVGASLADTFGFYNCKGPR